MVRRPNGRGSGQLACVLGLLTVILAGCGRSVPDDPAATGTYKLGSPYQVAGRWYRPYFDSEYDSVGTASWYGAAFHGRPTANGEIFDKERVSAAHPTLPLPSIVRVTNLENGRSVDLRVNDRGPFVGDRLIDLSEAAARELGFRDQGLAKVRVQFVSLAPARGSPPTPAITVAAPARTERVVGPSVAAARSVGCTAGNFVQVGAFADAAGIAQARSRVGDLAPVHIVPVRTGDRALARVRLGPTQGEAEAQALLGQAQARGYRTAFVVNEPLSAAC